MFFTGKNSPIRLGWLHWKKFGKNTTGGRTMFNQDFKEFVASLNARQVKYLIVGGYAVALHGYPRYTKDLDVWIEASAENAARLILALNDFGFGSLGLENKDFAEEDQVVQLGYPPNRIDLITSASGVRFEECYEKRVTVLIEGVEVEFLDVENLKKNKRASGRLQDLADVEKLEGGEPKGIERS